jgi:hypothetical protein
MFEEGDYINKLTMTTANGLTPLGRTLMTNYLKINMFHEQLN